MARFTRTNTPLLEPVMALSAGILAYSLPDRIDDFRWATALFILGLAAAAGLKLSCFPRLGSWRRIGMWGVFYSLGVLLAWLQQPDLAVVQRHHGIRQEFMARIENVPQARGRWYRAEATLFCCADSLSDSWQPLGRPRVQCYTLRDDRNRPPRIGDILRFRGQLYAADSTDYDRYMRRTRGIVGRCFAGRTTLLEHAPTWRTRIEQFRQRLGERLQPDTTLGSDSADAAAAVMQALTLGDSSGINRELRDRYARTGVAHLLAVSGLHVGIIFLILNLLFGWMRLFRKGRVLSGIGIVGALCLYAVLTGLSPSVIRAVVMFSLLQIGLMLSRSTNSLNTWCAAALLLLLGNPYLLYHIGFQLSFAATAAIITLYPPVARRWMPRTAALRWLWSLTWVGLAAQLGTFPLVLYHFGQIQWGGIVLNPILWFTVPAIIIGSLASLVNPWPWLIAVTRSVAGWQNRLVERWADFGWAAATDLEISVCLLLYLPVIALVFFLNRTSQSRRDAYSLFADASRREA